MNGESNNWTVHGCYPFGSAVEYTGSSFFSITDYIDSVAKQEEGVSVTILPLTFEDQLISSEKNIITMVKKYLAAKKGGLAYFSTSPADHLGLQVLPKPSDIICDVIVFPRADVPYVLSFTYKTESPIDVRYNLSLAKAVLKKLRRFTDEDFTFAFGLIGQQDVTSDKLAIKKRMQRVMSTSTGYALRKYLTMSSSKWDALTRAFITMYGITKYSEDSSQVCDCKSESEKVRIILNSNRLKAMFDDG